jgi:hypothetical protein
MDVYPQQSKIQKKAADGDVSAFLCLFVCEFVERLYHYLYRYISKFIITMENQTVSRSLNLYDGVYMGTKVHPFWDVFLSFVVTQRAHGTLRISLCTSPSHELKSSLTLLPRFAFSGCSSFRVYVCVVVGGERGSDAPNAVGALFFFLGFFPLLEIFRCLSHRAKSLIIL